MQPKITEYSSGIDWISFSSYLDSERREQFGAWYWECQNRLRKEGVAASEARIKGYRGAKLGDFEFYGRARDGHYLVRCHGEGASDLAQEVIERGIPGKCTRIDPQITATFDAANPRYAAMLRRQIRARERRDAAKTRQKLNLHEGCLADTGITVSDRSSAVFFRIYDWEAKHCLSTSNSIWRFEAELKEAAASQLWEQYKLSREPHKLCARTVNTRLQKYGVAVKEFSHMEANPVSGTKPASSIDKRKAYTTKTLLPHLTKSLELGLAEFLLGALEEHGILDALGLQAKQPASE
jgi:hypothetical protein